MVLNYKKHEQFDDDSFDNDIVLLRLQREVLINANVQVVRLPNRRQQGVTFEKQKVRVSG